MADIVDSATRSRMMAGIRAKNTHPERLLRSALHRRGFRFRLHIKDLAGKPDLTFSRLRAAVFVHGCFWHRHANCRYASMPDVAPDYDMLIAARDPRIICNPKGYGAGPHLRHRELGLRPENARVLRRSDRRSGCLGRRIDDRPKRRSGDADQAARLYFIGDTGSPLRNWSR